MRLLICLLLLCGLNYVRAAENAPSYQWQLVEKNRQTPLAFQAIYLSRSVDGTFASGRASLTNAQGFVDLSDFYQSSAALLEKYPQRVQFALRFRDDIFALPIAPPLLADEKAPHRLEIDLGSLTLRGHFVTANGQRVTQLRELYPETTRAYIDNSPLGSQQIRLWESKDAGGETLVDNAVRFDERGDYMVYAQPNRRYRFDIGGEHGWKLTSATFTTGTQDSEFSLVVSPQPYVLYGEIFNAATQKPVAKNITIYGGGNYFYSQGKATYALFFDAPGAMALDIGSSLFQDEYRQQKTSVKIEQPVQRHDFRLEPLAGDPRTLQLRLKISGVDLDKPLNQVFDLPPFLKGFDSKMAMGKYMIAPYLSGADYFGRNGQYQGNNLYLFALPQADTYHLSVSSTFFIVDVPAELEVKENQTLEAKITAKDTWLTVRVVDEAGAPIGFPAAPPRMHESRSNSVALETAATKEERSRAYLNSEPADVGGALRPDENGELHFLLAKGGDYQLRPNFEQYATTATPVQIATHQTKTVTLTLKRKP